MVRRGVVVVSQLVADVLWLERQYLRLPDLDGLAKRLAALEQQQAASWMYAAYTQQTTTNCTVFDFPAVCPCFPTTIVLHDNYFGDTTLTYDSGTQKWKGCKLVTSGPNAYTSTITPITYILSGSTGSVWTLSWQYYSTGTLQPDGSATCTTPHGIGQVKSVSTTIVCNGTTTWNYGVNGLGLYPTGASVSLSIHLPDGL